MLVPALDKVLPLESVSPTSFQQVPQAGPAPAPGAAPYRFWDTAAEKPGEVKKPQAAVSVWQLGEPKESPAPYSVKDALYVTPDEAGAVLVVAGEVLTCVLLAAAGVVLVLAGGAGAGVDEGGGAGADEDAGRHCEYHGLE